MNYLHKVILTVTMALAVPLTVHAAGSAVPLDRAPVNLSDQASLQRGAQVFVNYCMGCHSAAYMRYNRLTNIGLTEKDIEDNLLFSNGKVGDVMSISMKPTDAKTWFGATPPDLSVIARSRGADWLYTYMRTFYRDDSRPSGWNNLVFDKVGMPHVLWELQGEQRMVSFEDGSGKERHELTLVKPGSVQPAEYDMMVGDLVNYLAFMGEPVKAERVRIGVIVLIFLALFFIVAYALKKEYWKDIH